MAQIYFGKNNKLFVGLSFDLSNSFCFLWYFPLPFFTIFPCSTTFSIVLNCSCLGLWIVTLFLKFLMCFDFVYCAGLLFLMFQKDDARNMMPHWRNFQSWSKLLINFIQFLELVFVNKFEFSIMALNIDIYFVFIVFFIVIFLPLSSITISNFINYILITMRISIFIT